MLRQPMMFSKRGTSTAEVNAAISAAIGGDQFGFVESVPAYVATTVSTLAANTVQMSLVRVGKPLLTTKMTYDVGVASGTVDLGIYAIDGSNFARQASTGPTAAAGSNIRQTINLTVSFTFQPGVDYWLAYLPSDGTTQTARRAGSNGACVYQNRVVSKSVGAATLPATIAVSGLSGASAVWLVAD